jgi:hypothetical protein
MGGHLGNGFAQDDEAGTRAAMKISSIAKLRYHAFATAKIHPHGGGAKLGGAATQFQPDAAGLSVVPRHNEIEDRQAARIQCVHYVAYRFTTAPVVK